jgi:hypothetical protein
MPLGPRRVVRPAVRRRSRRSTVWARTDLTVSVAATGQQNIDLWADLEVAGSGVLGSTVLRTLIMLCVENWASPTLDSLRAGLIVEDKGYVGTTQALATNRNLDWMWWQVFTPTTNGATVNAAINFPADYRPYDIRSRRVVKDLGRTSIIALSNGSAAAKTVQVSVNQLIGLP